MKMNFRRLLYPLPISYHEDIEEIKQPRILRIQKQDVGWC